MRAAREAHHFLSVTKQGISAIVATRGNSACHVILRGSQRGPNYSAEHVREAGDRMTKAGLPRRMMVDCSHGNSQKDPARQRAVAESLADQLRALKIRLIQEALVRARGNQRVAAEALGMHRQSLTRMIRDLRLESVAGDRDGEPVRRRGASGRRPLIARES